MHLIGNRELMSIIKQIFDSQDPISLINSTENISVELVPILIFLYLDNDEMKKQSAQNALLKIAQDTELFETTDVIRPNYNKKTDGTVETRILHIKPQDVTSSIFKVIEYLITLFTNNADKYDENLRNDALDIFQQIFNRSNFIPTKQILLDISNFLLLFIQTVGPNHQKSYDLLNQIKEIAQIQCELEVVIAVQSILYLFPE